MTVVVNTSLQGFLVLFLHNDVDPFDVLSRSLPLNQSSVHDILIPYIYSSMLISLYTSSCVTSKARDPLIYPCPLLKCLDN